MKKKKFRKLLGILLCMTVLFTQALPVSFAYAEEAAAGGFGDSLIGEVGEDGSVTGDSNGMTGETTGEDQTEDQETEPDTDILQEEADLSGNGGEGDGTSDGVSGEGGEKETSGAGGTEELSDDPEEKSDISLLEEEAESGVDISWYTEASASGTETASISTAAQLRGLEALVNGTAVDSEGGTVARENFSGWTITLTADIDLSETDGAGEKTASEWTPIGSSSTRLFRGILDGENHEISGWMITEADTYTGFFGYLRYAEVRNLRLSGSIDVTTSSYGTERIGGFAGYISGSDISNVSVDVDLNCTAGNGDDLIGAFAGYMNGDSVEGCSASGEVHVAVTGSINNLYVGGMFGQLQLNSSGTVADLNSDVNVSAESSSGISYVGGIAGQIGSGFNGITIESCVNGGTVSAAGYNGGLPSANYAGGIAGQLNGPTGSTEELSILNTFNTGSVTAAGSATTGAGGIAGYAVNRTAIRNSANSGNVEILSAGSSDSADICAGGIAGRAADAGMTMENCYNAGNVRCTEVTGSENVSLGALAGSPAAGTVTACYSDAGCCDVLLNAGTGTVSGIGTADSGGNVTAADGYTLLYGNETALNNLLDRWVLSNVGADTPYCLWTEDGSGVLVPAGQFIAGAEAPAVSVSSSELLQAAGSSVTLTAKISAPEHSQGRTALTWQWYVSDRSTKNDPVALEGESASGRTDELETTVTYELSSDEASDRFYFIVVNSTVTIEAGGETVNVLEAETSSDVLNVVFVNDYTAGGYDGDVAGEFAGGEGTEEEPYLISTPAQLKLMAQKISDGTGSASHYRLESDIDFNNMRWTPAGEYTSGNSAAVRAFTGSLDGNGHTVSNLRIVAEGNYAGMFAELSTGTIMNLRAEGSMSADGATYAGGIVAYNNNANGSLRNVTGGIDITASGCSYAGGLAGYSRMTTANCAVSGSLTYQGSSSGTVYIGGLIGYLYGGSVSNCAVYTAINGDLPEGSSGLLVGYSRSTGNIITCCYVSASEDENAVPLYNNCTTGASGNGILGSDGQVTAADGQELAYEDVTEFLHLVNRWVIENADETGTYRYWIGEEENGLLFPSGQAISNSAQLDVDVTTTSSEVTVNTPATITAEITTEEDQTGEIEVSYRWYASDYASGRQGTDLEAENASGTLDGTTGTVSVTVTEASYSDRYYFVEVTRKTIYRDEEGDIIGTVDISAQDGINLIFKADDDTIYQGETADSYDSGNGTAENPYLISTPAQLKRMNADINSGEGASAHYKLTADIDFNNMRWLPAGSYETPFTGSFDRGTFTVSNLKILPEGAYAGMFGYLSGGSISNLTLEGAMSVNGIAYVGGIVGYLENGELSSVTNRMTVDATNADWTGGLVGATDATSGGTVVIDGCANEADVNAHFDNFTPRRVCAFTGGLVGSLVAGSNDGTATLINSYNTGDVTTDGSIAQQNVRVGGVIGSTGTGTSASHIINVANHGDVTQSDTSDGYASAAGIGYLYLMNGSVQNCVSTGTVSGNGAYCYDAMYVSYCVNSTISDCYVRSDDGSDIISVNTTSGGMGTSRGDINGLGYFDENGNLTAVENYTLNYERSDAVKAGMSSEYTDLFCALNNRAGEQNAGESETSYNSWVKAENGLLLPSGEPEESPVLELEVLIDDRAYGEIFEEGTELPAMTANVSGDEKEGTSLIYEWYVARSESGSDRKAVENAGENPSEYLPDSSLTGKTWYSAEVTAVNGYYFTSASSNEVLVQIRSDGVWEGIVADPDELKGYGTEAYPYLIENGEILALISEMMVENPGGKPDGEDSVTDEDQVYQPYCQAYYEITDDIVMDGTHELKTIGLLGAGQQLQFTGHVSGRQKEDGTYPTISGLVLNSSVTGNSSYCGLFGYANGAEFRNFNIENAKVTSSATNTGILAGYVYDTTISNVNVSGSMTGSSSYMGGVVGYVGGESLVEYCISRTDITNSGSSGGGMGGQNYTGTGGIAGNVSNSVVIQYCQNTGNVTGADAGGIAGGLNVSSMYQSGTTNITLKECVNTGTISASSRAGGIAGRYLLGFSTLLTLENCSNRGSVIVTGTGSSSGNVYAGGLTGYGDYTNFETRQMVMTNCYNTGSVQGTSTTQDYVKLGGLSGGNVRVVQNCYYMTDNGVSCALGTVSEEPGGVTALTSDEMKSAETAVSLGDAWIIAADGYPLLEWEMDAADICTVTAAAADETGSSGGDPESAPSVQIKVGDTVVSSLRAQTGAGFNVEVVTDSDGYSVSSVQVKVGDGEPQTLVKNADRTYTLNVTGDLTLLASMQRNKYTVQLKDVTRQDSGETGEEPAYQAGDEILIDLIVRATEEGDTADFAAVEAEVTFDPELLEYTGNSAEEDTSGNGETSGTAAEENTVVSAGDTAGTLKITRISDSDTTADSEGVSVVTLTFRALNRLSAESVQTEAGVSSAVGPQGSDPDLDDASQLAVPEAAEITLAPSQVVFITDYAAAPAGYKLAAYRTALALEDGTSLLYDGETMMHASAFDERELVPVEDSGEETSGESTAAAGGNVTVGESTDNIVYTYIYFVDDETAVSDAIGSMAFGEGSCIEVDYEDYDITENSVINIFDAQRVWDLFSYETFTEAVEFIMNPGMYQRLHADVNRDGSVNVLDALLIQRYLHFGSEDEAADAQVNDAA